jgi:hypothetical protein
MVDYKHSGRPSAVQAPPPVQALAEETCDAPRFEFWSTAKLGQMVQIARQRVRQAQARFEEIGATERRRRKRTYESEMASEHVRRAEDTLHLMRAELRRRALESVVESRVGDRIAASAEVQ